MFIYSYYDIQNKIIFKGTFNVKLKLMYVLHFDGALRF